LQSQADAELAPLWQRVYRDMHLGNDLFESFVNYQACLLAQFDALASVYHFQIFDASQPVDVLLEQLKQRVMPLLP